MNKYMLDLEPAYFTPNEFDRLLIFLHDQKASDITIQSGENAVADIHGLLYRVTKRKFTQQEVSDLINHIYGANATAHVQSGVDLDTSYQLTDMAHGVFRYRVNITACQFKGYNGLQVTLRTIASDPPMLGKMNLTDELIDSLKVPQGIVVISGATGSGKSTLLASLVANSLEQVDSHLKVLTYESPIEYVYDNVHKPSSIVSQCEIPKHLPSFAAGVRNALRRKPGLILVGEARDKPTLEAVIEAALTGHPVYTTVHSNGVIDTFRRMINLFSAEERQARLYDLIETVRVIVWQALVIDKNETRTPIREYLVITDEIKERLYQATADNIILSLKESLIKSGKTLIDDIKDKLSLGLIDENSVKKFILK
ncbi:ATPase [Piscirickettsia salmonis]|uniref:Dot/Icm secretion system ATPase DotB n=2 Tax=Piscirickettsia salmonis TaxID=1238 RepID=A0A9Q5YKW2_PISSA|nr:ATPase, T2SS/T4P/T4SS family [Piscirickettsia salmonis]RNC78574.1 ATPase [Piscirickettsiaceae bacterium NZ-RLO2]ALA25845.1 type IV secretion system protein DotB [Piscirickettsia salmonis]APS43322.1 ATPase [Piscirickettsia salmonis]APS46671.1 ATPase [Piscirickettsia salmonis]APS50647.1 ATPase [Piscirickettsia salmonis]